MRVLVSNDDGVDAPGIHVLAQGLRTNCQNGCNGSYSACINSVNLKATPIPQNKLPQNGKLFP